MAVRIPPPPVATEDKSIWNNWYIAVQNAIASLAIALKWTLLDFTGSNLTSILTKSHQVLDNLQGGSASERYHVTASQASAIATFDNVKWTDLTDAGDTILHYHAADRARANHTGTQTLATISDVTATSIEVNYLAGTTSGVQAQLNLKSPLASPTFTGVLTAPTIIATTVLRLKGYTVATLPAGTQGDKAFVTDALDPTYLVTVAGGGTVVTEVFYNGTAWVCT